MARLFITPREIDFISDLTKVIQDDVQIVGKRPGEKLNETLISESELKYTHRDPNDYIFIFKTDINS